MSLSLTKNLAFLINPYKKYSIFSFYITCTTRLRRLLLDISIINSMYSEIESHLMSSRAFDAYRALRGIADKYNLEINPPRIVFVGETSTGKSMLVQNFLGFPCAFADSGVATRCPVAYQLRYNPTARTPRVIKPAGIEPHQLAAHLGEHMKRIAVESGFSTDAYRVEIESDSYPDLEIYDVPGLVGGDPGLEVRAAIEQSKSHCSLC